MTIKEIPVDLETLWIFLNRSTPYLRDVLGGRSLADRQELIDFYADIRQVYFSEKQYDNWLENGFDLKEAENPSDNKFNDLRHALSNLSAEDFTKDVEEWQDYECDTFLSLVEGIKNHGKRLKTMTLVPSDLPMQLKVGFLCLETMCHWTIRASKLKQSINELNNDQLKELLQKSFTNSEGKHRLAINLSKS